MAVTDVAGAPSSEQPPAKPMDLPRRAVPVTVAEYAALPERPGVRAELLDGVVYEVQFPKGRHVQVRSRLYDLLRAQQQAHGWPGRFECEAGVELVPGQRETLVGPDVALFSPDQVAAWDPDGYLGGAPVLAVEIRSTHDRAKLIAMKLSRYLEAGTRLVWIVDPRPRQRSVTVYALDAEGGMAEPLVVRGAAPDQRLTGGDVLPGLDLPLAAIWEGIR
jgi:Uma2 family endonuclease